MAMQFNDSIRSAMVNAIKTAAGASALLRIYSGTAPSTVATALGAQVKLAELVCNATFAADATTGVLTLNAIANDTAADATGTAAFYQLCTSGGTAVAQGSVGTSGADLNLNTVSLVANGIVSVTSAVFTAPGA